MHPPNSRSQSSFLGASTPLTHWIDSLLSLCKGTLVARHFTIPSTWMPLSVSAVPVVVTSALLSHVAAQRSTTAATRTRASTSHELSPWYPCQCRTRATPFATCSCRYLVSTLTDAATQLSFADFFERCIFSKAFPPRPTPPPQPKHMGTSHGISSSSGCDGLMPVPRTQPNGTPPPPPGLRDQARLGAPRDILTKAAPMRPHSECVLALTSPGAPIPSTSPPSLQPHVSTTQVGTHTARSSATHQRSASTAPAGTHFAIGADPRAGRGPFPKLRPVVLPMVRFGLPKPPSQCRQPPHASSTSSLYFAMESRSSAQEPHPDYSNDLWTFSRSHLTRSQ